VEDHPEDILAVMHSAKRDANSVELSPVKAWGENVVPNPIQATQVQSPDAIRG